MSYYTRDIINNLEPSLEPSLDNTPEFGTLWAYIYGNTQTLQSQAITAAENRQWDVATSMNSEILALEPKNICAQQTWILLSSEG